MQAVQRALWFVESHLAEDISLERIAAAACVSRFHLARAFATATGQSVMRYVRARRLSMAARQLAGGAGEILTVALDAGYGSHEAFTRAFRDQFGCTPEAVRNEDALARIALMEPLKMNQTADNKLGAPRLENGPALLLAGLKQRYACGNVAGIPSQWQRFTPFIGNVPGQIGNDAYGVIVNADDEGNIDYLCGVPVENLDALPPQLEGIRVPAREYLVFKYSGHVANVGHAWSSVWNDGLATAGMEPVEAPAFEHYGPSFNPETGQGGLELWVPVRKSAATG